MKFTYIFWAIKKNPEGLNEVKSTVLAIAKASIFDEDSLKKMKNFSAITMG